MARYLVWFLLTLCPLFWATNFIVGSYVSAEITPFLTNYLRWALALFLLFPVAQIVEKPNWKSVWKQWKLLIVFGVLGIVSFNLFIYSALKYISPTNVAVITALNPAVIVLFSVFLLQDKISKIQVLGLLISLIGVLTLLTKGNLMQIVKIGYNKGNLLMLAAIISWALYSILGKRIKVPPITATAVSSLFSVIIMSPFAITQGSKMMNINSTGIKGVIFLAIFPSTCAYVFWNISIRKIGANKASIFLNLTPVFTAIISIFLGDKLTLIQVLSGLCVLFGVYLAIGNFNACKQKQNVKINQEKVMQNHFNVK